MRFLILITFIINIIYTPNIAKADNFLGNCNLGNEGQYLNTAFQIVDEFGFNTNEILASMILTLHNINFYQELMKSIRHHIKNGTFDHFHDKYIGRL